MTRPSDEELRQAGREMCDRTRAEQGLPPKVTDPVVLDRIATIVARALDRVEKTERAKR